MNTTNTQHEQKVVVIGGGISGLAIAALLALQGWRVTVLEKNRELGGRARVLKKKGFTFDMGPSWYMMSEVFERYFAMFGKKVSDFYQLERLHPRYKVFFDTQKPVVLHDSLKQNAHVFDQIEQGAGKKLRELLKKLQIVYDASTTRLMYENIWAIKTWLNPKNWRALSQVAWQIPFWKSWDALVKSYFSDQRLQKILGFPSVFLGGSPFNTPSLYSILIWSDFGTGIWYPKGGMMKVVDALRRLAEDQGVEIKTHAPATEIVVKDHQVVGVKTTDTFFEAQRVVGATDLAHLETQLLSKPNRSFDAKYWQKKTLGISALMLYLGLDTKIKGVVHHNIRFADDWETNFQEIFYQKTLPTDPSIYISIRTATDPTISPKGTEEVIVLVPLAASTHYTEKDMDAFQNMILDKIEQLFEFDIRKHILVKELFTPKDFAKEYNAFHGTALGLAHTFWQSLWFRPHNKSKMIDGLYTVGQYTNPGVGVPMCLVSAQMVANMIGSPKTESNEIFKKSSVTYYYSSLFFTGQIKKDVFCLYAYVRKVDDCVDTLNQDRQTFEYFWQETQRAWNGHSCENRIVQDFVLLAKRKHFQWEWVESFWKAMRSDLIKSVYTDSELEEYMYGSAEVIGYMMASILQLPKKALKAAALQGKAMQYMNFIRDVKEDEELGRNYLGYSSQVRSDEQTWNAFLRKKIKTYEALQKEAELGYAYIPKKFLIPIKTAADMYRYTAKQIEQHPMIVWDRKVKPTKLRVLTQVLKNMLTIR